MKKYLSLMPAFGFILFLSLVCAKKALALNQYNWGTSTGGSWITPDDTVTRTNQFLQIGQSTTQVVAVSTPAITPTTLAVMNASTPTYVGQLIFVSNAVTSTLCISSSTTGSPNGGSLTWIPVISSFTAGTGTILGCR